MKRKIEVKQEGRPFKRLKVRASRSALASLPKDIIQKHLVKLVPTQSFGLASKRGIGEEVRQELGRVCPVQRRPEYDVSTNRYICYEDPYAEPEALPPYGQPCCLPLYVDSVQGLLDLVHSTSRLGLVIADNPDVKAKEIVDPIFHQPVPFGQIVHYLRHDTLNGSPNSNIFPFFNIETLATDQQVVEYVTFLLSHGWLRQVNADRDTADVFTPEGEESDVSYTYYDVDRDTASLVAVPGKRQVELSEVFPEEQLRWMLANSKSKVPDKFIEEYIDQNLGNEEQPSRRWEGLNILDRAQLNELETFARNLGRPAVADYLEQNIAPFQP